MYNAREYTSDAVIFLKRKILRKFILNMKLLIGVIVNMLYLVILVESLNYYEPIMVNKIRNLLGIEDGPGKIK